MKRRARLALALCLALTCQVSRARADLAGDVRVLRDARARLGAVRVQKPRLLERGDSLPILLPPEYLNPREAGCTTVTLLGVPDLHFALRFSEAQPSAPSTAFPEASTVGALEVTRCGEEKSYLEGLFVEQRSPRGLVETIVSHSLARPPPLIEILPGRDPGTLLELGDPGPRPPAAPLAQRQKRLETRARRDGASAIEHDSWLARQDGAGGGALTLSPGCHELSFQEEAVPISGVPPVDLDMEVVDSDNGTLLALDRSDNTDAQTTVCVGVGTTVEVRFAGASPDARVPLTHASWPLPRGLPETWGPGARAPMARLARAERFAPDEAPIYAALGVQGTTTMPLEIEPDGCYTVLLSPLRGAAQNLSLSVLPRIPGETAHGSADANGSAVAFCAHGASLAEVEVDGRGSNLAWLIAVWETGRLDPGLPSP